MSTKTIENKEINPEKIPASSVETGQSNSTAGTQESQAEDLEDQLSLDLVELKSIYKSSLSGYVNVEQEANSKIKPILQKIANKQKSVLLSFVAAGGKKVNPYDTVSPAIRPSEELAIELAIENIKIGLQEQGLDVRSNLILVIQSPGGYVSSSFVIAKMIRSNFKNIKVFVPNFAVSGGTLIALTGNEIVMGEISKLSPLDTQLRYNGVTVSVQSYRRAIERFEDYFKDKNQYEVPYIWKSMGDKFDPIIREEWDTEVEQMWFYIKSILSKVGYSREEINQIALDLLFTPYPHEFVIDRDRAKDHLKLKIKHDSDYPYEWQAMKTWYSLYTLKAETNHSIRYIIPEKIS